MLEKNMLDQLNGQLNLECYSHHLYWQMSAWCAAQGFPGSAGFLRRAAQSEQKHLEKLLNYISDTGALPLIGTISAPPDEFPSLPDLFQQIYEHEQAISDRINTLVHQALTTQDYTTFNFLQWFVSEQCQEEKLWKRILDQLEWLGNESKALFLFDQSLQHTG